MKSRMCVIVAALAAAIIAGGCAVPGERPAGYLSSTVDLAGIQPGKTTGKEIEQMLGAPARVTRDGRRNWDYWEYPALGSKWRRGTLWIGNSGDGVVRDVVMEKERPVVG